MMKYYFLNGEDMVTIDTRHTVERLRALKPEYNSIQLYEKKQDVPIPEGYKLTGDALVKTADKIKQEADEAKQAERQSILDEALELVLLQNLGIDKTAELAEVKSRLEAIEKSALKKEK